MLHGVGDSVALEARRAAELRDEIQQRARPDSRPALPLDVRIALFQLLVGALQRVEHDGGARGGAERPLRDLQGVCGLPAARRREDALQSHEEMDAVLRRKLGFGV